MFRATGVDESEVAALGEDWRWLQEYERAARHELWAGAIITLGVRAERAIRDTLAANGVDPGSEHALGALVGELHKLKRPTRSLRHVRFIQEVRNKVSHDSPSELGADAVETHQVFLSLLMVLTDPVIVVAEERRAVFRRMLARLSPLVPDDTVFVSGLVDVDRALERAMDILRISLRDGARDAPARVRVLGLDLRSTWPVLQKEVLSSRQPGPLDLQVLMVDPDSPALCDMMTHVGDHAHVSATDARRSIEDINTYLKYHAQRLAQAAVHVDVHAYGVVPVIHGVSINDHDLFWSYTRPDEQGMLMGGDAPYHHARRKSDGADSTPYFAMFNGWFDAWRRSGTRVAGTA